MDAYIYREPVFDRDMNTIGYELHFGQSIGDFFFMMLDVLNPEEMLLTSFSALGISDLTGGKTAFMDFSKELYESESSSALLPENTVAEIHEGEVEADPVRLKKMGYHVLLDCGTPNCDNFEIPESVDIVRMTFSRGDGGMQSEIIGKYGNHAAFLAAGISTWEDREAAQAAGYALFTGNFYQKPKLGDELDVKPLNICILNILQEFNSPEPSFKIISDVIEHDLGLSYKLLKLVNSVHIGPKYKIKSIAQALTILGTRELYQWISLMLMQDMVTASNTELVRLSLLRGRLMSQLAYALRIKQSGSEAFFAGMFSLIDILLGRDIEEILDELPLTDSVKQALMGGENNLRVLLDFVIDYENANWNKIDGQYPLNIIEPEQMEHYYIDALKWAKLLDC